MLEHSDCHHSLPLWGCYYPLHFIQRNDHIENPLSKQKSAPQNRKSPQFQSIKLMKENKKKGGIITFQGKEAEAEGWERCGAADLQLGI